MVHFEADLGLSQNKDGKTVLILAEERMSFHRVERKKKTSQRQGRKISCNDFNLMHIEKGYKATSRKILYTTKEGRKILDTKPLVAMEYLLKFEKKKIENELL